MYFATYSRDSNSDPRHERAWKCFPILSNLGKGYALLYLYMHRIQGIFNSNIASNFNDKVVKLALEIKLCGKTFYLRIWVEITSTVSR